MATWIGIDIGKTAVKVAVLRTAYRKVALTAMGSADVATAGGTAEAIKAALGFAMGVKGGEKGGTGDGIAVGLEGAKVAVRMLSLPASAQKQLAEVLPFELETQVPFDMTESVFDFRVMESAGPRTPGTTEMVTVMAAVARTADVKERIDLVKGALGVEPERVGVGSFPIANLVPHSDVLASEGPIVVVDLGTLTSEVLILKSGESMFARALSFGTQGLPATAPRLAREIRVTIAAYRATGGANPVRVLLCGGGAFVSGAESFLAGELELPVESLAVNLDVTGLNPEHVRDFPRFAKAIGLAVGLTGRGTNFDLRRGPLSYERGFAWVKEKIPVLAGLTAVIVVSFFFTAWAQLYSLSKEKETLEKALGTVTKEVLSEETFSAARANELLGQQTAINDEDPLPHADAFDVMVKLSDDVPPASKTMVHDIEELEVQKGHAVVHGIVGTIADAQSIATSLRNEKCFSDVKITRNNAMVGADRQKYLLEFDIKCPEDIRGSAKKPAGTTTSPSGASSAAGDKGGK